MKLGAREVYTSKLHVAIAVTTMRPIYKYVLVAPCVTGYSFVGGIV